MGIDDNRQRKQKKDIERESCALKEQRHQIFLVSSCIRFGYLRIQCRHEVGDERMDGGIHLNRNASSGIDSRTTEEVDNYITTLVSQQC